MLVFWHNLDRNKEVSMGKKRYTPEQIIGMLREAEVGLSRGLKIGQICRNLVITEQTYYRWRREYGGLKVSQAKRLKILEKENSRLKRAVADLTLDKLILKEALEGNF
jgi:transposase-like protein